MQVLILKTHIRGGSHLARWKLNLLQLDTPPYRDESSPRSHGYERVGGGQLLIGKGKRGKGEIIGKGKERAAGERREEMD